MIRCFRLSLCLTATLLALSLALPGCNSPTDGKKKEPETKEGGHGHGNTGPHGGPFADWDDTYHAEFTVDHDAKRAVIYILDDKAAKAPKVEASRFSKVKLVITSPKPGATIDLTHDPKLSGELGIAYVGTHDSLGKAGEIKGEISGTFDEGAKDTSKVKRYGNVFHFDGPKADNDKKKSAQLNDLYLKPGGIYTEADIQANGNTTPAAKFKGIRWTHSKNLKAGDKICPVTDKKAQAECHWIVNGQRYEFCCPPCLDNFMEWAHDKPSEIKNASSYVYKGM